MVVVGAGCADILGADWGEYKPMGDLFVRMRLARTGDCTVSCTPDEPFWAEDAVDAAYAGSHSATLLVGNQIMQRGDSEALSTGTSRVQLYEAEVRVDDIEGNPVTDGYVVPITGFVDPGTSDDAGYNCTEVLLIDGATMDTLRGRAARLRRDVQVLATVVLRGRTLGGEKIETAEWSYPIRVCFACSRCEDTYPPSCCANTANEECQGLDEIKSFCSGQRAPQDCRNLDQTCADYINSFGL
ncbi:hypothetical protein WME98_49530 [Sorangium sp. So ce296]|uniref:hypothetical protein n=1 Tax=Sorangium sp. So ce296 TaxID=3133296 RepID=UPI003F60BD0B